MKIFTKTFFSFFAFLILVSCSGTTQTTSGQSYLEKYANMPVSRDTPSEGIDIEQEIRNVAAVEPTLRFPAKIGLARIDQGRISVIPGAELEAWQNLQAQLGEEYGEFIPLNPMIAEMVSTNVGLKHNVSKVDVLNKIRLGAARQHLDAVLIYETYDVSKSEKNILAITDITIIGSYLLPSRAVKAKGYANALFIDVMQAYPYGSVDTYVEEEALSTTTNRHDNTKNLGEVAKLQAVEQLTMEALAMFSKLKKQLEALDKN